MKKKFALRLYIAGLNPDSQEMILNFKEVLGKELKESYSLDIVDVLEQPGRATDEKILATPTVVRLLPEPIKKFVLDLASKEHITLGLDLIKQK